MIDSSLSKELLDFFNSYLSFYKQFLLMETEKFSAIEENRVQQLQEHIKQEEVFILRSKGMEQERENLLSKGNCSNVTFQELLALVNISEQDSLKQIYQELSQVLLDLKEVNRRCQNATQIRLHHIHTQLDKLEPANRQNYTASANSTGSLTGIFSKKV